MKIGVFADVHGNLAGLHQVLQIFADLKVDELICAGDLTDKGPHGDAVIDVMQSRQILCVQGNHDATSWLRHPELLTPESIHYLSQLPPILKFAWADVSVCVSHANPWQDSSIYVYPTSSVALFREVLKYVDERILILGHSHQPMFVQVDEKIILNPGSVYDNRHIPQRTCGVLTLPPCQFDIYDIATGHQLTLPDWGKYY